MQTESHFSGAGTSGPVEIRAGLCSSQVLLQAGFFLFYLLLIVAYQWVSRAFTLPFGGYSDEPAHFVSSLMVGDYLRSRFAQTPMAFAEQFYVHYPAVAFGMWGPLLHILGGVWTVVFGGSRMSILLLIAVISASFAWSTQWLISREFGWVRGLLAGLALCLVPDFYIYSGMVMADILAATMLLWAAYYWYRYMQTERTSMSLLFGIFASLALLTKANPGILLLLPVPAVLLAGRADLLRRRNFWIPVPLVAVLTTPWYVMWFQFMDNLTRVPLSASIAVEFLVGSLKIFGLATIPIVLAGMASGFGKKFDSARRSLWAVTTVLTIAFILYHCVVPGGNYEGRYVLMIAPWVAVLLVFGAEMASEYCKVQAGLASTLLWGAIVVFGMMVSFHIHPKTNLPYADVVNYLLPTGNEPQTAFLISSESAVDTIFVAEVALHDHRPNHFVLRASHMLARMNWNGDKYYNKQTDESQILEKLNHWGVSRVVIDTTPGSTPWPHHRSLRSAIMSDSHWQMGRQFGPIEVYEFKGNVVLPEKIEVEVPYTLRRTLQAKTGTVTP